MRLYNRLRYSLLVVLRSVVLRWSRNAAFLILSKWAYRVIASSFSFLVFCLPGVKAIYAKGSWADETFEVGYSDIDLAIFIAPKHSSLLVTLVRGIKFVFNFFIPLIGEIEIVNQHLVNTSGFDNYRHYFSWRIVFGKRMPGIAARSYKSCDIDSFVFTYTYHLCQNYIYGKHPQVFERMAKRFLLSLTPSLTLDKDLTQRELMILCHDQLELRLVQQYPGLNEISETQDLTSLFFAPIMPFLPPTNYRCNNIVGISMLPSFSAFPAYQCRYAEKVVTTHPIFVGEVLAKYLTQNMQRHTSTHQGQLLSTIFCQWRGVLLNSFPFQPPNRDCEITLWGWIQYSAKHLGQPAYKEHLCFPRNESFFKCELTRLEELYLDAVQTGMM